MKKFRLHYYCASGGDGSVSVNFYGTEEQAEKAEEKEFEESGESWGESSVSYIELMFEDDKITFQDRVWEGVKLITVTKQLEELN